jgi:hypothetical protein
MLTMQCRDVDFTDMQPREHEETAVYVENLPHEVPEGWRVEFTRSGDGSGGFDVCYYKDETRDNAGLTLHSQEKRTFFDRAYFNGNGKMIARQAGVSEWTPVLDKSDLPIDWKTKR